MSLKLEETAVANRLTTILFDLDDTLFDHIATARASLRASAAPLPFFQNVDFEPFYQLYSELLEEYHALLMAGRYSYFVRANQTHYPLMRQPVAGALALLQALKPHYRIGIVTNNRTAEQEEKLAFLGMTDLVDALITSEDVGTPKPNAQIFEVAMQRLGARPQETVLVGDNWRADVLGALAVGIRPVWLNRLGVTRPLPHVAEITSLEPLADALRVIVFAGQAPTGVNS